MANWNIGKGKSPLLGASILIGGLFLAGCDDHITVIRDFLGHASVATTSRYITTNLKMKRDVLEAF